MSPRRAMGAGIALLPGDRQGASGAGTLSVRENVTLPTLDRFFTGGFLRPKRERARVLEVLRQYDVRPVAPARKLETLSGGNQQKALVAKWLERKPTIFLMHEPVQGVDVSAREEIARVIAGIAAEGGSVLLSSCEYEDLARICGRVLVFRHGRVTSELERHRPDQGADHRALLRDGDGGMRAEEAQLAPDRQSAAGEANGPGPLAGVRIIELGQLLAGPFTGRLLGDLGAEIIKVEAPGQPDPMRDWGHARYEERSLWWPVLSRNKKCVTLNLRAERGQELLLELVRRSDVVVENFRPGTLERWNLGFERMREVNEGIILARVSGYGQTGPYAGRAGFASVSEAMGGLRYINGFPDEPPPRIGISLGDSLAGMFAAQGVMAALYKRDALGYGRGQIVDASILEACFALLEGTVPEYDRLGIVREPSGTSLKGVAPSNIFKSRDGKWMVIAANQNQLFRRLCEAMGQPELADDPRFETHLARGRQPGGARRADRRLGRPARRRAHRPRAQRCQGGVRPDLHDRRHLPGPALPGPRHAHPPPGPGVRRVHRPRDRAQVLRDPGRGPLVGHLGGGLAQRTRSTASCSASPTPRRATLRDEGVL